MADKPKKKWIQKAAPDSRKGDDFRSKGVTEPDPKRAFGDRRARLYPRSAAKMAKG